VAEFDRSVQTLLERPPFAPTPVAELRARAHRRRTRRAATTAFLGILVVALVATFAATRRGDDTAAVVASEPSPGRLVRTVIPTATGATDVAVGKGAVWVPGFDVVRLIDPEHNAVSGTFPISGSSDYRSVTVAFDSVWITDTGTGMLTRINGDVVIGTAIGNAPTKTIATADRLWVVQGNGDHETLTPVDPNSMTAGTPIQLDDAREAFPGLAARDDILYVTYGPRLIRYDTRTGETRSSSEYVTRALAVVGDDVVAITDDHRLVRFDGDTLAVRRVGPVVPAAQDLAAGDGVLWVLAQPSSVRASTVARVDPGTLAPVGKSVETGLTSTGLAADRDRLWVTNFSDSSVTRIDSRVRAARPELCPGSTPIERASPDGLPPVQAVTTDLAVAQRSLDTREADLRAKYPDVVDAQVGPGYGRAWSVDANGRTAVVAVDDYAILLTLPSRRDCPRLAQMPAVEIGVGTPVFLAFAR
jgi:hypothetical protein